MSEVSGEDTATPNDVAEGQGRSTGTDDLELPQQQDKSQDQDSTQQTEDQGQGQSTTTAASIGTGTDDLEFSQQQSGAQGQGQEAWNLDSYLQGQGEDKNPFSGLSDEHLNQLEDVLSSDAVKSLLQQAEFQNLESSLITGMDGPSTSQHYTIDEATAHQIIQDGVREHELAVIAAAFNDHAYAMPLVRQAVQNITTSVEPVDTPSPSYEPIESPSSSFKSPATPTSSKGKREDDKSPHEPIRRSTRISDAEQREMAEKILQENRQKAREALLNQEDKEEEKEEPKKGKRGRKPKVESDSSNPLNTKWNKKNRRTRSAKNGEEEEEEAESGEEEGGGATEEDTPKPVAAGRGKKATEGTETPPPMKRVSRGKWKNPLFKDRPESDGNASPAKNPASPASAKGNNSPALTRSALKTDESESDNKPTPKRGRGRKKKVEVEEKEEGADEKTPADDKAAASKKAAEDKNGDAEVKSIPYTEFITQLEKSPKGKKGAAKKGLVTGKKGLQKAGTLQTKKGKAKVKDPKESGSQSSEEDIPLGQLQQRTKPKVKPKLKATLTEQPAATEEADDEDIPLKTLSKLTKSPSKLKKLKAAISSKRTVKMLHKKPGMTGKSKFLKTLKPPSQMKMMQKKKMAEKKRLEMEQKLAEEEAEKEAQEAAKTPTAADKNAAKRKARKSETEVFIDPTMTDLFKPDGMIVHEHEKEAQTPEIKFDAKGHRIPDSEVKVERKDSDSKQVKVEKSKDTKQTPNKQANNKAEVKVEKPSQVKVEKPGQVKVEKSEVKKSDPAKVEKKSDHVKGEKTEIKRSDSVKGEKPEVKRSDSVKGEKPEFKRSDSVKGQKSEIKKERRESSHHEKHRHSSDEKRKHSTEERHRHSTDDRTKSDDRRSVGENSEKGEKERRESKASNPDEAPDGKADDQDLDSESDGGLSFEDDENDEDWLDPNTVYCLCRKPHSNRFMIECDCCEKWFHGSCVGVTETMGKEFEALDMNFVCPVCTESGKEPKPKPTPVKTFRSPVKPFTADSKVSSTTLSGDSSKSKHSKSDADNSSSKSSDKSSSKHHHRHHHHKDSKHRDKSRDHSRDKDRKDHKDRHRSHSKDHKRSKHHRHEEEKKTSEKKDEGPDPVRLNVRKHLRDALSNRAEHADDVLLSSSEIKAISLSIEEEMFNYFKDVGHKYRNKYRSLIFNIKDTKNNGLFRKILNGKIRASKLVQMSSTELASKELAEWRKMETKHTLKLIEETEKKAAKESFHIRKKTHKGEIEIDEDMSNLRDEAEKPTPSKPKIEPKADLLSELIVDTTDKHRLHLFDSNCKICTGKQAPPSEESTPKKVTISHAVDKEKVEEATKETTVTLKKAEQVVKEALANVKKTKIELPDSPVTVRSPDSALQSGLEESRAKFKPSGPVMWKGFIHMQEFNKFFTSAYRVSGPTDGMSFADTIQICGRIIPEQIWDYLSKIKQAGTRDVCVIRFIPAGDDEKTSYVNLYSYLNSRARCGVVGNSPKQVKDFYIIPLASHSRIPQTLLPFDGPGLEENRPHMLIGVLVRQKSKPPKSPLVKEASKSKHSSSSHSSASSSKKPRLSVDSPSSSHKDKKTSMYVPKIVTPGSNSSSEPSTPGGYKEIQDPIIKAYAMEEVVAIETEESSANDTEAYSPGRVEEEEVPYDPEFEENNSGNATSGPSSAMARAMELTLATIGEPAATSKPSSDAPKSKVTISLKSSVSQSKPSSSQPSSSKKEVKSCLKNPISTSVSEDVIPLPQEPPSFATPSTSAATASHHQHQHHQSKPGINIEKLVQQIANSTNRSEITALMVTALAASKDATDQQKVLADLTRKVEEQKKLLAKKKAEIEQVRASTLALTATATASSMSTASQPAVTQVTESPEKLKTSPVQKTPPKVDYVVAVKHKKHDPREAPKPEEKMSKDAVATAAPIPLLTPVTTKELDSVQISKALDALKTTKMLDNLVSVFKSTQSKNPVAASSTIPLPTETEVETKAESISVSAMKHHEMPLALQALMKDVMGHGSESGIKSKKIQKEKEKKVEEPKSDLEEDKDSLAIFKGVNKREKNVIPGLDDLPISSVMTLEEKVVESATASDGDSSTSDTQTSTDESKLDKDYRNEKKTDVIDISLDKDDRQAHSLDKDDRKVHSLDKDERIVRGMLPRFIPTQPKKDWTTPATTAEQAATWSASTDVDHRKFPQTANVSTPQPPAATPPVAKEGKFRPVGVPKAEEVKEDVDHRKLDGPMRPIGAPSDPFGFGIQDVDMRRPPTGQKSLLPPPPMPPASNVGPRPLLSTPPVFQGNQPPFRPPFPTGDQRFRAPGQDSAMKRGPPFQPSLSEGEPSDKRPRFPGTGPGFRQPLLRPPAPPGTEPVTLMPPGMPPLPSEPLLPPPLPPPPLPSETVQDKDLRGGGGDPSRFGNRQSSPQLEDRDRFSHHRHRQHDRYHNRDKDYRSRNRNRRR